MMGLRRQRLVSQINSVLGILLLQGCVFVSPCTESEHRDMQERFSSCRADYNHQFYNSDRGDEDVCRLLESLLSVCTQEWKQCHSVREINNMKSMHTEAFIEHWQTEAHIEECEPVKQFRSSLLDSNSARIGCNDEDSSSAINSFQSCSHATSVVLYTSVTQLQDPAAILDSLCSGLRQIAAECPSHLATCFAPDDISQMKELHLAEMKKFYYTLVVGKVSEPALDSCKFSQPQTTDSRGSTETHLPVVDLTQDEEQEEIGEQEQEVKEQEKQPDVQKQEEGVEDETVEAGVEEEEEQEKEENGVDVVVEKTAEKVDVVEVAKESPDLTVTTELNQDDFTSGGINETNDIFEFEEELDREGWSVELNTSSGQPDKQPYQARTEKYGDWLIEEGLDTITRILGSSEKEGEPENDKPSSYSDNLGPRDGPQTSGQTSRDAASCGGRNNSYFYSLFPLVLSAILFLS